MVFSESSSKVLYTEGDRNLFVSMKKCTYTQQKVEQNKLRLSIKSQHSLMENDTN